MKVEATSVHVRSGDFLLTQEEAYRRQFNNGFDILPDAIGINVDNTVCATVRSQAVEDVPPLMARLNCLEEYVSHLEIFLYQFGRNWIA